MKHFILVLLLIASFSVHAQVRFAPEAGIGFVTINGEINGSGVKTRSIMGLKAGFFIEGTIAKNVDMQVGLSYVRKGYRETFEGEIKDPNNSNYNYYLKGDLTSKISYVELPVNIVYKISLSGDEKATDRYFVFAGPYFGIMLRGKTEGDMSATYSQPSITRSIIVDEKMTSGNDPNSHSIRPIDLGLNLGLGYQFKGGFLFRVQYGFSIYNNMPAGDKNNSMRHSGGWLTIGHLIK